MLQIKKQAELRQHNNYNLK